MVLAILIILGLCFGSFINAFVWRLHEQSLPKKKRVASDKDLSITKGRSMCPHCQHALKVTDLLPVVSWVVLRGRCRYCKRPISWQYPVVELILPLLFVISYAFWPFELNERGIFLLVIWLASLVGLVALVVYDVRWMLLPNKIVFPLVGIGILQTLVRAIYFNEGWQAIGNAVWAVAIAGGVYYILFQVSRGKWIGGGDVKLGYALGLLLMTPSKAFLMLFLASLIGLVIALPGMLTQKLSMTSKIPFGPSLIAATVLTVLFGQKVIDWYVRTLLI